MPKHIVRNVPSGMRNGKKNTRTSKSDHDQRSAIAKLDLLARMRAKVQEKGE